MPERLKSGDIQAYFTKTFATSFLLREILPMETPEHGHPYYRLLLQDAMGSVTGVIWKEYMKDEHLTMKGRIVDITSLVSQDSGGHYSLIVRKMSLCSGYDMYDYIDGLTEDESSRFMLLLDKAIDSISDVSLKRLLENIFGNIECIKKYPATVCGHHHFCGGYLVYICSVAIMSLRMSISLSAYNISPSSRPAYRTDLLVSGALLHSIGTIRMLTPAPGSRRRAESLPLNLHELTVRHIQDAVCRLGDKAPDENTMSLLFHIIGCVYESELRKPMLREALILKNVVELHDRISLLEHFISKNRDKTGIIFDDELGNYIYVPEEVKNGENVPGQ